MNGRNEENLRELFERFLDAGRPRKLLRILRKASKSSASILRPSPAKSL